MRFREFFCAAFLVLAVSCADADRGLVGTWQYYGMNMDGGLVAAKDLDTTQYGEMGKRMKLLEKLRLVFRADGSGEARGHKPGKFKWVKVGQNMLKLSGDFEGEREFHFGRGRLVVNWNPTLREYVFERVGRDD